MKTELRERVLSYMTEYHMTEQMGAAVIGVSGGADSVCLLLLLLELSRTLDITLLAVHVEHGIRGEESRKDAEFVTNLCRELGVACIVKSADVPRLAQQRHESVEEAARNVRYAFFEKEADALERQTGKKCCIAVAHNANDNAETMLYHLARGTGLAGLTGIAPVRGRIVRPLLFLQRNEIEEYLKSRNQKYCLDRTNEETVYSRNMIRHEVLPKLVHINAAAVEHMGRTARMLAEVEEYLNKQAGEVLRRADRGDGLSVDELRPLPDVLKKEVLRLWISRQWQGRKDLSNCHISDLLQLMEAHTGKELCLPGHHRIVLEYGYLKAKRTDQGPAVTVDDQRISFRVFPMEKSMKIPRKSYTKWFDYDKIKDNLVLRNRQEGDYLVIDDRGRRKLLRRYLMDEKIPRDQRDALPLLCCGSHVVWVIGYRISEAFKVSETTEKILEVQFREEKENE